MRVRKQSKREEMEQYGESLGLTMRTWSPGDGTTRYRFFDRPGPGQTYFGPANGIHTALGMKQAWDFLYSYAAGRGSR